MELPVVVRGRYESDTILRLPRDSLLSRAAMPEGGCVEVEVVVVARVMGRIG